MKTSRRWTLGPFRVEWIGWNHPNTFRFGRATTSEAIYLGIIKVARRRLSLRHWRAEP